MTGFEYAAAGLMIQNGLVKEGIGVIDAIRERYDGKKRNPFSEIECGASYARSMASFSLPAIFSGFTFDKRINRIGFAPVIAEYPFRSFWSFGESRGTVCIDTGETVIKIHGGVLMLDSLKISGFANNTAGVSADGKAVSFTVSDDCIIFNGTVSASEEIRISLHGNRKNAAGK